MTGSLWLSQRCFCKGSRARKVTAPSSGTQALAHSVSHAAAQHLHPAALSPPGSSRCRQGGQQAEGPGPTTSPCATWDQRCPTNTIPIHPQEEWKRSPTFRKLFRSLVALPSNAHASSLHISTWETFPALPNSRFRPHPRVSPAIFPCSCLPWGFSPGQKRVRGAF